MATSICVGCPAAQCLIALAATGLQVKDWQDVILVNMLGKRFYDETGKQFTGNNYKSLEPYTQGSYLNAKNISTIRATSSMRRLRASVTHIMAVARFGQYSMQMRSPARKWNPTPPDVDVNAGLFFKPTHSLISRKKIVMKYQRVPTPAVNLEATVARYNSFVDFRDRRGLRQVQTDVQDRQSTILCRMVYPGC